MGDDDGLAPLGQGAQPRAHRRGRDAADAGVNLVEHPGRLVAGGRDAVERQQHPRQLAARGRRREGGLGQPGVRPEPDHARVVRQLGVVLDELDPQLGPGHREVGKLVADRLGQPRRGLGPGLAQGGRDAHRLVQDRRALLREGEDLPRALVEPAQGLAGGVGPGDDLGRARPVAAAQARIGLEPLLHLGQPPGLGVEVLQVGPQRQGRLLEGGLGGRQVGVGLRERAVNADERLERPRGAPDGGDGPRAARVVLGRERLGGGGGGGRQPLRVAQPLALGQQRRLLLGVEAGVVHRRHQLLQVGALALGRLAPGAGAGERAIEGAQPPPQRRQPLGARDGLRAGERVERRELAGGADEAAVLVLGREADQRPGEGGDGLARRRLPVDQCPRPPLGRHAPRDDDLALVLGQLAQRRGRVILLQPLPEPLRQGDGRLHEGVPRARAHGAGVGRRTGQQRERLGEDGLAGARLAGDRRQARGRGELGPLDHHEVPHLERADHGRPNFSR